MFRERLIDATFDLNKIFNKIHILYSSKSIPSSVQEFQSKTQKVQTKVVFQVNPNRNRTDYAIFWLQYSLVSFFGGVVYFMTFSVQDCCQSSYVVTA